MIGVKQVTTHQKTKELKIIAAVVITLFISEISLNTRDMLFRVNLVGVIFLLFGSLGILTNLDM